jgi:ABC-type multidrug transport system fused ATPase/permease subunit
MNDEKRAELLLDHYKDTFQNILYHWKLRNRFFVYVLILIAIIALDTYQPGVLSDLVNAYITKTLECVGQKAPKLDFAVIRSAAWFLLLSLVIQYYQRSICVDRQNRYIGGLEEQICQMMDGDFVTREGKAYYSKTGAFEPEEEGGRPLFLRAVGPLYVYFFPLVLVVLVILKVFKEDLPPTQITNWFNIAVGVVIVLYNVFYVVWVKFRK